MEGLRSVMAFWRIMPVVWPPEVEREEAGVWWTGRGVVLLGAMVCFWGVAIGIRAASLERLGLWLKGVSVSIWFSEGRVEFGKME